MLINFSAMLDFYDFMPHMFSNKSDKMSNKSGCEKGCSFPLPGPRVCECVPPSLGDHCKWVQGNAVVCFHDAFSDRRPTFSGRRPGLSGWYGSTNPTRGPPGSRWYGTTNPQTRALEALRRSHGCGRASHEKRLKLKATQLP